MFFILAFNAGISDSIYMNGKQRRNKMKTKHYNFEYFNFRSSCGEIVRGFHGSFEARFKYDNTIADIGSYCGNIIKMKETDSCKTFYGIVLNAATGRYQIALGERFGHQFLDNGMVEEFGPRYAKYVVATARTLKEAKVLAKEIAGSLTVLNLHNAVLELPEVADENKEQINKGLEAAASKPCTR